MRSCGLLIRHVPWLCTPQTLTNPKRLGTQSGRSRLTGAADKASSVLGLGSIGGSDEPALPETVCDKNVQAVMEDAYQVYALFYGTVQRILRCTQMQACLARLHKLRKKIRKASKARREWHRQSSVGSVADALDSEDGVRAIIALALHCPRRT